MELQSRILTMMVIVSLSNFGATAALDSNSKLPTVVISILVRNKAHILPYFFDLLTDLDYPKSRISIRIYSDHNEDNSIDIIQTWVPLVNDSYHSVFTLLDHNNQYFKDEEGPWHWSVSHMDHVINLREKTLTEARKAWADHIWMLDADVLLTDPLTLRKLIATNHDIVAPMLVTYSSHSNYWCGMDENYYYKRTEEYQEILRKTKKGCFEVPMVHSAVLINLKIKSSDLLSYDSFKLANYDGPRDDIITLVMSAKSLGLKIHICNDHDFGFIPVPSDTSDTFDLEKERFINLFQKMIAFDVSIKPHPQLSHFIIYPKPEDLSFSKIYVLNLLRRPERRVKMELIVKILGLGVTFINAVDGRSLSEKNLDDLDIQFMPEYRDPYKDRPMTLGEIGCFLSHYNIWKETVDDNNDIIMVLEDDIDFEPFFKMSVTRLMEELKNVTWDFVYLGRKQLDPESDQPKVTEHAIVPLYSYWTVGYIITQAGARKLLDAEPLQRLIPVDEFLPIMYDSHPNSTWSSHFNTRGLVAFSALPLLLYPDHYPGEQGYFSDTEDSFLAIDPTERSQPSFAEKGKEQKGNRSSESDSTAAARLQQEL